MARIGMNPGRGKQSTYSPARVTAAVLVHIPHFSGYFEHRFPVLRTCLASLVQNTAVPFDLLVFDNGSCDEVVEYLEDLQQQGVIQFLMRSRSNLGKLGAFQIMFRAAPGQVVAYCDDDFYFFPSWLEAQLELLDAFPGAGMVSGYAVPSLFAMERISTTLDFAQQDHAAQLKEGKFIPEHWIREWALSTGRDPDEVVADMGKLTEYVVEYKGLSAFTTANHDQFIAPKEVIQACLPGEWSQELMGQMLDLDVAVNRAGFLRLATHRRTSQHLGNELSSDLLPGSAIHANSAASLRAPRRSSAGWWKQFLRWAPVRSLLLGIYSKLFRLINPD